MAKNPLSIEYVSIDKLVKWPKNPKLHSPENIEKSFNRFGFVNPIIVDEKTGRIVAGHGRIDTAQKMKVLGLEPPERVLRKGKDWLLPVVRGVRFENDREAEAYLIADNQLTMSEGFDNAALSTMIKHLQGDQLAVIGMTDDVIKSLQSPISIVKNGDSSTQETEDQTAEETKSEDRFIVFEMEKIVDAAYKWFRENGFPYPVMAPYEQMQEINHLSMMTQEAAMTSRMANRVADCYHRYRFEVSADKRLSPLEAYKSDKHYRRSLELQLIHGGSIAALNNYQAKLDLTMTAQACSNFRPGIAMYVYRRFGKKKGIALDPCAGFGGRLVGWIASHNGGRYIGVDPAKQMIQNSRKMADSLGVGKDVELYQECFEDFNLKKHNLQGVCNLVFTSPPYFTKERYSQESTQSFKRYPKFKSWLNQFLKPLVQNAHEALKPKGIFAINIADIALGSTSYPLELFTQQFADDCGFKHLETIGLKLNPNKFGQGENLKSVSDEEEDMGSLTKQVEPLFIFEK